MDGSNTRYRASVSRTSKGYSVEWTVERTFADQGVVSREEGVERQAVVLDNLRAFGEALEVAYPAQITAVAMAPEPSTAPVNGKK
ncbi:MAG: hypothetical protein FJ315_06885 [SAR202 cluster bacterium]|nr:hypothetical protein [SAR202 cluster bacterium]